MKGLKRIIIGVTLIVILFLIFERPLLNRYYTSHSVEIEVKYNSDMMLNVSDIKTSPKSKCVQYEDVSDETMVKLPYKSNIIAIKRKTPKSRVYKLQACFEREGYYCFAFSCMLKHFPYNDKTHCGDMLIVLDNNGNKKYCYKSKKKEWILDYNNGIILIYNSSENSFYYKNINSGELLKEVRLNCGKYGKIVLDYCGSMWNASFYIEDDIIFEQTVHAED